MNETSIKILEIRATHNLTQNDLASMLGVTPQTVSRWEAGTIKPNKVMQYKMHRLFGVEFPDVMRDKEPS